jgi:drug/metabolite transporter (DMT)-like permease
MGILWWILLFIGPLCVMTINSIMRKCSMTDFLSIVSIIILMVCSTCIYGYLYKYASTYILCYVLTICSTTIISIIMSYFLFHEKITPTILFGCCLCIVGAYLVSK